MVFSELLLKTARIITSSRVSEAVKITYEEKLDAIQAFCYKYKSLIDEAPEGSDLWVFRELCDSFDEIDQVQTAIWMDTIETIKVSLVNAMYHLSTKFEEAYHGDS